jgi:putative membrane protein
MFLFAASVKDVNHSKRCVRHLFFFSCYFATYKNNLKFKIMYMYDGYHFGGMHLFWWIVWMVLIVWIFVVPYNIPGQRMAKDTPLDVLKKKYANGEINKV